PPFKKGTWRNYTYRDGLPHNMIVSIYADPDGTMWFGTDGGLARYDGKDFVNRTKEDGLPGSVVFSVFRGPDDLPWIVSNHGVVRYDERNQQLLSLNAWKNFGANEVYGVERDPSSGALWFHTSVGLSRYDGKEIAHFPTNDSLRSINSLH